VMTETAAAPAGDRNRIGLAKSDYDGSKTTLCPGCGHNAITAGIIQAAYESNLDPHRVAKLSGIGCSSKTPAYFLGHSHGFNAVCPCMTFADHQGPTQSYAYVKEHDAPLHNIDFVPFYEDITVDYEPGTTYDVEMPDGSHVMLQKLEADHDARSRERAMQVLE